MVGDPSTQATGTQRAPQVNVIATLKLHRSQAPDLNTGITRTGKGQCICSGLRLNNHSDLCPALNGRIASETLAKYIIRNIDNHMANWKVIALVSGNIEAVSGPAAQDRRGAHEWIVWQGVCPAKAGMFSGR
jgi:hypothetical protein